MEELMNLLYEKSKVLKCAYVAIFGNKIYGSDKYFAHVSTVPVTDYELLNISNIVFTVRTDKTLERTSDYEKSKFVDLVQHLHYYLQYDINMTYNNIHELDQFKSIMEKKAADGIFFLKLDDYIMSINKTLIPMNKNDKINVSIRDQVRSKFLAEFNIQKGKNIITKYFMFMRVLR